MEGAILASVKKKKRSLVVPNEIVNQIFLNLPVKALLKFKCVCKEWICIIKDSEFVNSHRIRFHKRSKGIGVLKFADKNEDGFCSLFIVDPEEDSNPTKTPLPIPWSTGFDRYIDNENLGVIEGLVCFDNFVLNPSTKEVIKLPDQERNWDYKNTLYYIGFDTHSKTYKVLTFHRISNRPPGTYRTCQVLLQGRVLTLGTTDSNSWRDVFIPKGWVKYSPSLFIYTHLSVDNKIFFLIYPDHYNYYGWKNLSLLVFGVQEERFIGIIKKLPLSRGIHPIDVLEVNGRLALMRERQNLKDGKVLWILEDYDFGMNGNGNGSWIKRNIVFPEVLKSTFRSICKPVCTTIHSSSGATEILFKAYEADYLRSPVPNGRILYFYYNLATNDFRVAKGTRVANETGYTDFWLFKHVETMFQLKPRPQPTDHSAAIIE